MQQPNWDDIRTFLAVARAGQISRAATRLKVDPTTISRRVRRLEFALGQTLFEQTRKGQLLTQAGEQLLEKAEAMNLTAMEISETIDPYEGLSGLLRLSVAEGFGTWFLSRYLREFAEKHPRITVDLIANSGILNPSRHEADIAIALSRPKAGPVVARKLSDYALRLYASPAYMQRKGRPGKPADLVESQILIGYVPDLVFAPELRYLDEFHTGLAAHLRSSSINAQHRLLIEGAGIGVLPCFIGDATPGLEPVFPDRFIRRSFWMIVHRDIMGLARVRAARQWLVDAAQTGRHLLLPKGS